MLICNLCPLRCGTDRDASMGRCHAGRYPHVALASLHFWEEPFISGTNGSGAVFFSGCNMDCIFCQNHELHDGTCGKPKTPQQLCSLYLSLQEQGAHNINLVTPTPHLYVIRESLLLAKKEGLTIPIVYNTNGYDTPEGLKLMNGLVDIYLPDFKYVTERLASFCSATPDYFSFALPALREMYAQTGSLITGEDGMARRGMVIRHLVLPGCVDETRRVLDTIRENFPTDIQISLMRQYAPTSASLPKPFNRKLTDREYDNAVDYCLSLGFYNVLLQEKGSATLSYTPVFTNS